MKIPAAFSYEGNCIILDEVPITINETISCCQDTFDCDAVFDAIDEANDVSIYATQNCVEREDVGIVVEAVAQCYATKEFMTCMRAQYIIWIHV